VPSTPTPGGVAAEQRYRPRTGVEYVLHVGRVNNCQTSVTPAPIVTSDEVRVVPLEIGRSHDRAREHPGAESRREPFNLKGSPYIALGRRPEGSDRRGAGGRGTGLKLAHLGVRSHPQPSVRIGHGDSVVRVVK